MCRFASSTINASFYVIVVALSIIFVSQVHAETRQDRINTATLTRTRSPVTTTTIEQFEDEDDDDDFSHQLVIFAIGGLTSGSFSSGWMPFTFQAAQAKTNHARTIGRPRYESLGWLSYFYAATPEEYGCSKDDVCNVPPEVAAYHSLFDVLQYDYSYAISIFSENPPAMEQALRHHYSVRKYSPDTLEMMSHGMVERELPQTERRALLFHFDGADRIGHSMGFDRENYHAQVLCLDWQIEQLATILKRYDPTHTTFALISDHGGKFYEHSSFDLDVLQVPIAWWGYGVCSQAPIGNLPIDTTQWASTTLDMIGLDSPNEWIHPMIESASCDDNDFTMPGFWNETRPGVCPVNIGFRHHYAHYAEEVRTITTLVLFGSAYALGYWLFHNADDGYEKK